MYAARLRLSSRQYTLDVTRTIRVPGGRQCGNKLRDASITCFPSSFASRSQHRAPPSSSHHAAIYRAPRAHHAPFGAVRGPARSSLRLASTRSGPGGDAYRSPASTQSRRRRQLSCQHPSRGTHRQGVDEACRQPREEGAQEPHARAVNASSRHGALCISSSSQGECDLSFCVV
jgi:hypothetical protein